VDYALQRRIDATADEAWKVIADVEGYHRLAAVLSRVELLAGEGEGMERRCYDTRGRGWTETCTLWQEGSRYTFAVDTSTYPPPLRQLLRRFEGTWTVEPEGSASRIGAHFRVEPRFGFAGRALLRLMGRKAKQQLDDLLDRWAEEIRSSWTDSATPVRSS
jgi:ribosome-associated toxin RatA of RatAB toxin-antitoxin module